MLTECKLTEQRYERTIKFNLSLHVALKRFRIELKYSEEIIHLLIIATKEETFG